MSIERKVTRMGGSLGITIPRDIAAMMGVSDGSDVRLSIVGRQLVIEPQDDTMPDTIFQRSLASVLRRYGGTFKGLADFDAGRKRPR